MLYRDKIWKRVPRITWENTHFFFFYAKAKWLFVMHADHHYVSSSVCTEETCAVVCTPSVPRVCAAGRVHWADLLFILLNAEHMSLNFFFSALETSIDRNYGSKVPIMLHVKYAILKVALMKDRIISQGDLLMAVNNYTTRKWSGCSR